MISEEKKIRITNMLKKWNEIRWNHKEALNLFSSGAYFSITPEDVIMWATAPIIPKKIHCYMGVENSKMYFILIDSETDRKPINQMKNFELDKIVIREFSNTLDIFTPNFILSTTDGNVTVEDALSRNLFWQLMKGSWVKDQIDSVRDMQVGIARVFSSPFSDLEKIQEADPGSNIIAVMGLKRRESVKQEITNDIYNKKSPFELDLCFWGLDNNNKLSILKTNSSLEESPVEDLNRICPPFYGTEEAFSLIFE